MLAVVFFTISIGAHGVQNYCLINNAFDLNANYAAKLIELMSGIGSILGFVVPLAIGQIVSNVSEVIALFLELNTIFK